MALWSLTAFHVHAVPISTMLTMKIDHMQCICIGSWHDAKAVCGLTKHPAMETICRFCTCDASIHNWHVFGRSHGCGTSCGTMADGLPDCVAQMYSDVNHASVDNGVLCGHRTGMEMRKQTLKLELM